MSSPGRNDPCLCGSGKKFKNCCLKNKPALPAPPLRSADQFPQPALQQHQSRQIFAQALALHRKGQIAQAQALYEQVLQIQPSHFDALHFMGIAAVQIKNPGQAVGLIGKAIAINPQIADAYYNLGNALQDLRQHQTAIDSYDKAIALRPDYAEAYSNRGNALQDLEQHHAAIDSYAQAIALKPDFAEACNNCGNALQDLEQHHAAIDSFDQSIALRPGYAQAYSNRGNALQDLKQHQAAIDSFEKALALRPDFAEAYYNRGNAMQDLKQHQAAIDSYAQAIALKPDFAEAYSNRGNALQDLKQHQAAIDSYDKTIALRPDYAEDYSNRGFALRDLKQHRAAIDSFDKAIELKPDHNFLHGVRLHSKMHICDWRDMEKQCKQLEAKIGRGEKATTPFAVLAITNSPSLQRKAAEIYVRDKYPASDLLPGIRKRPRRGKIRIGYFSADFRDHPVSLLAAGLFEAHDKSKFELIAFSFGPDTGDDVRKRVVAAFDQFIDVRDLPDRDVAMLARKMEIDIAVDLGGFTADRRIGIFALRAAPLQVNYLGYAGTTGAEYMDYMIADPVVIPEEARHHYAEKIVYLPCFMPNDAKRRISDKVFTREESGLPSAGFVFCCFNNHYKIAPATFDIWMRILKRVEGSVLWLSGANELTASNLKSEAARRGVDAGRIIFAGRMPLPEDHLARLRVADLFLDTLPYNAHATASDALWAGLPVLTCMGEAFAGRVSASLLHAVRLPELVTSTREEYEALAVALATDPSRLKEIRGKLAHNRLTSPLFDTQLFARHIEAAYTAMVERYRADMPPEHILVAN